MTLYQHLTVGRISIIPVIKSKAGRTMGEAKRRRTANAKAPCPCGSSKPGGMCCYDGRVWHKPPALLGLRDLPPKSVVEKCYMKELRSCDGGISGEHLISESVILLLK